MAKSYKEERYDVIIKRLFREIGKFEFIVESQDERTYTAEDVLNILEQIASYETEN